MPLHIPKAIAHHPRVRILIAIKEKRILLATLTLVFAVAALLRFHGIEQRGIIDYDEGWYLLEAKSLYDAARYVLASPQEDATLRDFLHARGNVPWTSFKPLHTAIIFISFVFLGIQDYAALIASAICGLLTVVLVYQIGRDLFGRDTGLAGAAFLAVSAFHVSYSRSAYGQADSVLFTTVALWLLCADHRIPSRFKSYLAGVACGLGIACHYNVILIPALFVGVEVFWVLGNADWQNRLTKSVILSAGTITPLLLIEFAGQIAKRTGLAPQAFLTYSEQFFNRDTGGMVRQLNLNLDVLPQVFSRLYLSEGVLWTGAIVIGILAIVLSSLRAEEEERTTKLASVLAVAVVPILIWSLLVKGGDIRFRVFPVSFPALAVIAGFGIGILVRNTAQRFSVRPAALGLVTASVILLLGVANTQSVLAARSGYRLAAEQLVDHVRTRGGDIAFRPGSIWPVWNFYLSAEYEKADQAVRNAIRFYVQKRDSDPAGTFEPVDFWRYYRSYRINDSELRTYFNTIENSRKAIVRVANPFARDPGRIFEAGGPFVNECLEKVATQSRADEIIIYDLAADSRTTAETGQALEKLQ